MFCGLGCKSCALCSLLCFQCSVFCVVEYIHYLAAVGSKSPAGQLHMSLHVHLVLPLHLFTFANFATVLLLAHVQCAPSATSISSYICAAVPPPHLCIVRLVAYS